MHAHPMTKWTEPTPQRTTTLVLDGTQIEVSFDLYPGDPDPENNDPSGWVLEMVKLGTGWVWAADALSTHLIAALQEALTAAYMDSLVGFDFEPAVDFEGAPLFFAVVNERGQAVVS